MSLFSSCKTIHSSPSYKEHICDCAGVSQGGCLTHVQGQMPGPELGLVEMSEAEYAHLQHLFQSQMETQAASPDSPDPSSPPAAVITEDAAESEAISLFTTQAMDLSTSCEDHNLVMPGEKTPASFGEVPGFVLARMRGDDVLTEPRTDNSKSAQKRLKSSLRVCLETRFNTISSDTPRRQDVQSAVLSNSVIILQQSAERQEAGIHPRMQKWMKTDRAKPFEIAGQIVGSVFNPGANMCEQAIGGPPHTIDPHHQEFIVPKNFSFIFRPDKVVQTAHFTTGGSSEEKQQLVNSENGTPAASRKNSSNPCLKPKKSAKTVPASPVGSGGGTWKKKRPYISPGKRREMHNMKERERRKMIRLCCDELNMLVPFCKTDSDKVTTLQWTTVFLRYIDKTFGDTFKEKFKRAFIDQKGLFLKSCPMSNEEPMHQEMDEILATPLAVEQ